MALNDTAVITAAQGFVYTAPVGTAAPTPAELDAVDPEKFGSQELLIESTGSPVTYTLTVGVATTPSLAAAAGPAVVQAALEALSTVGSGNVIVEGVSVLDAGGLTVFPVGALQGQTLVITGTPTGGTTPTIDVSIEAAPNGWEQVGHTSREDMPEWGFDGGDTEVRGTWQKKRLREIATGDPVADSVVINIQQWDAGALELYYGENASVTPGVFGVDGNFVPVERALLIIIVDGSVRIGFYASKASIRRDDAIQLPVDDFASLPVKATFLNLGANRLYDWISEDLL